MEIAALSEAVGKVRGCVCRAAHRGCGFQAARPRFSCESENFFVLQESFLCDSDYLRFCKKIFLIPRVRFLQIPDFIDFARKASCKHRSLANSAAVCQIQPQSGKFSRSLPNSAAPGGNLLYTSPKRHSVTNFGARLLKPREKIRDMEFLLLLAADIIDNMPVAHHNQAIAVRNRVPHVMSDH